MRYLLIIISLMPLLFAANGFASDTHPKMIVVSAEVSLTPDDVTEVSLRYSRKNKVIDLKVQFSEGGKTKIEKLFKSNKGKQLALIDGKRVIVEPVYLQTEAVSDEVSIYINDEEDAFNLLRHLSK